MSYDIAAPGRIECMTVEASKIQTFAWKSGKGAFVKLTDREAVVFSSSPAYTVLMDKKYAHIRMWFSGQWNGKDIVSKVMNAEPGQAHFIDAPDMVAERALEGMDEPYVAPSKKYAMFDYSEAADHPTTSYRVTVKTWITKFARESDNDFVNEVNDGERMPLVKMEGVILAQTKGMVFAVLKGFTEPSSVCNHCGRKLTHPVSLLYGIGPICGQHYHEKPDGVDIEAYYRELQEKMPTIVWEGWIPKSAIKDIEPRQ